jgi:hypothetical protein
LVLFFPQAPWATLARPPSRLSFRWNYCSEQIGDRFRLNLHWFSFIENFLSSNLQSYSPFLIPVRQNLSTDASKQPSHQFSGLFPWCQIPKVRTQVLATESL